jgi:hypothetical protein
VLIAQSERRPAREHLAPEPPAPLLLAAGALLDAYRFEPALAFAEQLRLRDRETAFRAKTLPKPTVLPGKGESAMKHLEVKTSHKAGRITAKHPRNTLRVRTGLKAGRITANHARNALALEPARVRGAPW